MCSKSLNARLHNKLSSSCDAVCHVKDAVNSSVMATWPQRIKFVLPHTIPDSPYVQKSVIDKEKRAINDVEMREQ